MVPIMGAPAMTVSWDQLARKVSIPSDVQQSALVPDVAGLLQGLDVVPLLCLAGAFAGLATAAIGEAEHDGRIRSKPAAMIARERCMTR